MLVSEAVLLSDVLLERLPPSWRRSVTASNVTGCSLRHFLLLVVPSSVFFPGWRLVCSTLRVHDGITRIFLSNLRCVRVHFAIQRGSFVSNRGAKELQS